MNEATKRFLGMGPPRSASSVGPMIGNPYSNTSVHPSLNHDLYSATAAMASHSYMPQAFSSEWCRMMLLMRIDPGIYRRDEGLIAGESAYARLWFDACDTHVTVVVIVKSGQEPVIFTDPKGLFPSDTLVTAMRLLV